MAKVNVSLPDDLLAEVDALAQELDRSRSGLVQEATARYVADVRDERARAERRDSIEKAMTSARKLGQEVGYFDTETAVREDRDRGGRKAGEK